jgi:hypothetical protein
MHLVLSCAANFLQFTLSEKIQLLDKIHSTYLPLCTFIKQYYFHKQNVSKAIPVIGHGDLQGCGMLRIPHV